MTLIILTKSPKLNILSLETYKKIARKIFQKDRGPQAVTASVTRGLESMNYEYKLNPSLRDINSKDTIWVNESIAALRWAITYKKKNKETRLIVGPNLVVTPDEENEIVFDDNIDIILQPSEWTKKLYESYNAKAASKIHIWPAGVIDPYENTEAPQKENYFIVYQKNGPQELFDTVVAALNKRSIPFHIIKYGYFKNEDFLSLLDKARGLIQLSSSESQGIALQEAWIRDVPTLLWDRGYWEHQGMRFEYDLIGSPYLTNESGMSFKNIPDFQDKVGLFLQKLSNSEFKARDYCLRELSDKVTTAKYLAIIRS